MSLYPFLAAFLPPDHDVVSHGAFVSFVPFGTGHGSVVETETEQRQWRQHVHGLRLARSRFGYPHADRTSISGPVQVHRRIQR